MLSKKLDEFQKEFTNKVESCTLNKMVEATNLLKEDTFTSKIAKEGFKLPNVTLLDHNGNSVKLYDYFGEKPTIINFYRGTWCPYCNLELKEYNEIVCPNEINMLAISPEVPSITDDVLEVDTLKYKVLSDKDNKLAKELNLVFTLSEEIDKIYSGFGIDVDKSQGNNNKELPVPATYVVDKEGVIKKAWTDVDYTKRAEPQEVVDFYKSINCCKEQGGSCSTH